MVDTKDRARDDIERFFNLSLDMLCIAGTDGRFKRVNPAFERTLGWTAGQLLKAPFFDFIHPDDVEATEFELGKLAQGIPTISFENRYRCADGSYKYLRWTSYPEPETGLIYAVAHDISSRKRRDQELLAAKEAAEAADEAKSRFLANISHEIRTPMNGIIGMAEMAMRSTIDDRAREYLQIIRQSADALLSLIGDILDFSKIEAGKIELETERFVVRTMIGDALKALALTAHRKSLELVCRVDPRVPNEVVGDAVRLRQVVTNLVGNAIKFTDAGEIIVDVAMAEEQRAGSEINLRFEVRDTGIGIAAEKQETIFESFAQGQEVGSRRPGGTGLGLSISARLVELMGGTLEVESELHRGSTFRFNARVERLPASRGRGGLVVPSRLRDMKVLVVDDNATQCSLLTEILSRWRIEASTVSSAGEALVSLEAAAEDGAPDLLLVDLQMPAMSGFALIEELNRRGLGSLQVVAMLSAAESADDLARCARLGAMAHLMKPFTEAELLSALRVAAGLSAEPAAGTGNGQSAGKPARRLEILLVEDNEVNQLVASGLLTAQGHSVEVVDSGRLGVEKVAERAYDLVLMDVQMPGMDGLEATAAIRAAEQGSERHVPIVALTARADREGRERCLAAGMDGYVTKPIRAAELLTALDLAVAPLESEDIKEFELPPATDLFDSATALLAVNGDRKLLLRVATAALREAPVMLTELEAAVSGGDPEAIHHAAHRLKGSIALFGTSRLAEPLEELEDRARRGDVEDAERLSRQLAAAVDAVLSGVRELLARGGCGPAADSVAADLEEVTL